MLGILAEAALRSLLLAGVVQAVLWLLRVRRAEALLATWTIVMAASMAMPMLLQFTPLRLPLDPALPGTLIDGAADLLQQPALQAPPGDEVVELRAWPSLTWLEAAYIVVGSGIALRVILGVGLSFRLLARAVPVRPEWAAGHRVRISRDIAGPVTIAHVILLPTDVVDWSAEMRRAVLAHEGAHVARWDFATLIVSQLNRALFWFNPLSWWLHRRLVTLTEMASDDQAIASTRDRLGYAEILLEMGRRSGPLSRGPAMARPSTLSYRIDRMLLQQALPQRASRPQQALLMAGAAGLSLAVASLAPGTGYDPAITLLARQQDAWNDRAIGPTPHDADVGDAAGQWSAAQQVPSQEGPSTTTVPQLATEAEVEARSNPSSVSPQLAPLPANPAQPRPEATLPARRPVSRSLAKNASVPPPSRAPGRPAQVASGQGEKSRPGSQALSPKETPSQIAGSPGVTRSPADYGDPSPLALQVDYGSPFPPPRPLPEAYVGKEPLAHQVAYGSPFPLPRPDFEAVVGNICTGTVAVGQRSWRASPGKQPDVVAGQTIPAQAQFFRKDNGTPWVRFGVFGRLLDLPVRFARSGMTWTGEYGISYTVQAASGNRLAGLTAPIADDSAKVELACVKAPPHLLASYR